MEVRIDTQAIPKARSFKYLRSLIQDDRKNDDDATHRIIVGCTTGSPLEYFAIRMYHQDIKVSSIVVVRPTLLYGVECWSVKKAHVQTMKVVKMRMLR